MPPHAINPLLSPSLSPNYLNPWRMIHRVTIRLPPSASINETYRSKLVGFLIEYLQHRWQVVVVVTDVVDCWSMNAREWQNEFTVFFSQSLGRWLTSVVSQGLAWINRANRLQHRRDCQRYRGVLLRDCRRSVRHVDVSGRISIRLWEEPNESNSSMNTLLNRTTRDDSYHWRVFTAGSSTKSIANGRISSCIEQQFHN